MPAPVLTVDPLTPDQEALRGGAAILASGGIVAYPTDTLYGLAVNPRDVRATERLAAVKGRAADRAFPLIAADLRQVLEQVGPFPPRARALADRFWPGPPTLVVRATGTFAPL